MGDNAWLVRPLTLGDTWKAQNLHQKVDHIVVVMMENRSFDHVLGYRAQLPDGQGNDGLTTELIDFLSEQGFSVQKLNQSNIKPNELGFKTKFPVSVGHGFEDVAQQLGIQIVTHSGHGITSPKGFVDNFRDRGTPPEEITPDAVLGYYEAKDLPFFKFLAENYSFSEQFFSSHPGPTLPNRMFSLAGNLQYDRTGEAGLNNGTGEFSLSRAQTIFDLLTRKRVGWRVYESNPSVTMLRMFARYATDNTNIVRIARLQQDVDQGNLPSVTFVDPAMHHSPPNDDHAPFADMYRGQLFLKGVYDTLRSNEALWRKTMLIITYDEHGGFYDHVIPPIADVRMRPRVATDPSLPQGNGQSGHFTSSTLVTNYGVRVPTFVVSPWSPVGKGPGIVLDFCSILKTIVARFCGEDKPFVSDRVHASRSLDAYLSEAEPRMNVPASPSMDDLPPAPEDGSGPRAITTNLISRQQMQSGGVDYHDLTGMLARLLGR